MKFFVLATCHKSNDHCSFIVDNTDAGKCFEDAQNELKRRCIRIGEYVKYVIVQFTRVE